MKADRIYLEHIQECASNILEYTRGGKDDFMDNRIIQDAVIRNFEIIGEATKQLSDETTLRHTEVPWREMARFRDILIHHYLGIDLERVWLIVETNVPVLKSAIDDLLDSH